MAIKSALLALSIHLVAGWISPLSKGGLRTHRRPPPRPLSAARATNDHAERYPGGEVVGNGKIGSYLLHRLNGPILPRPSADVTELRYPQSLNAAAVPRGVAAGCLSPAGAPIYACVPSSSIRDVWDATVPSRREDLVFLCNCIPSEHLAFDDDVEVTVVVLHFGVSHTHRGEGDASSIPIPQLDSSPESPPTVVYGKHADTLAHLLREDGIPVHVASHPREVQVAAARKLAWSSLMWLMCHGASDDGEPITVKDVHETKSEDLQRLVEEVLPSLEALASKSWTKNGKSAQDVDQKGSLQSMGSVQDVLSYLEQYSLSISNGDVIPSRDLALREIRDRNGLLLRTGGSEQSYHKELIRQVAGEEILAQCLEADSNEKDSAPREFLERIKCASSNLEFLFHSSPSSSSERSTEAKTAIVVGAGMVGCNIAYHLSRRGAKVTVMDRRTNLLPPKDEQGGEIYPGTATCSSFAWLNSNDKGPLAYKQFNQLGMEVWRRHDVLKPLPVWCGSLVRTVKKEGAEAGDDTPTLKHGPYYTHVGPLSSEEARRLEPGIDWSSSGSESATGGVPKETEVHFYPEEGHVNPYEAVKALRLSARENGVDFAEGVEICNLVRDANGKVVGVEYVNSQDANSESAFAASDVVVVAAGANSSDPSLGIGSKRLKLLDQPGMLAFARGSNGKDSDSSDDHKRLKAIFVDTIAEAHVLRRPDGTIVVGGGQLVVGGGDDEALSGASSSSEKRTSEDALVGSAMIQAAAEGIAPYELQHYELVKVTRANRPMPSDGFPVVGFVDQGLYLAVMHSAITMGPLVGELAAYEVWDDMTRQSDGRGDESQRGFQILDRYRPSRSRKKE